MIKQNFYILIFVFNIAIGQVPFDSLLIYIQPFGVDFFDENSINTSYIRENSETIIRTAHPDLLIEFHEEFKRISSMDCVSFNEDEFRMCRVVIDFLSSGKKRYRIAINRRYDILICDYMRKETNVVKHDKDFLCLLKKRFSFLIETRPTKIKCE